MAKPKRPGKPGVIIPPYDTGMGRAQGGESGGGSDGAIYGRRGPGSMRMQLKANGTSRTGSKPSKAAKPRQSSKKKGK